MDQNGLSALIGVNVKAGRAPGAERPLCPARGIHGMSVCWIRSCWRGKFHQPRTISKSATPD